MQAFEHIIWDWNGTLLDDTHLCIDVINAMLRSRGLTEVDKALYQELFGFPIKNYYQNLGFDLAAEPFESLAKKYCEAYDARVSECALHVGAVDVLAGVLEFGATQSILSAHEHGALQSALNHYGITDFFAGVYGLNNQYAVSKIERGRELLENLDIDPSSAVLVGDTVHDYEVASALGVQCVLVSHGHHSRDRLGAVHDNVITSLHAVLAPNNK